MRTVLSRHLALISYIGALWTKFSAAQSDGPQFHPANQVLSYAPRGRAAGPRAGPEHEARGPMLTKDILFGMNILTLAGFIIMGLSLTLQRMAAASRPLSIGLMCAGTALVLLGLYASDSSN
jgi:hypothetical protein